MIVRKAPGRFLGTGMTALALLLAAGAEAQQSTARPPQPGNTAPASSGPGISGPLAIPEAPQVRASVAPGRGRISFDFPAPMEARAEVGGDRIVLSFARPVSLDASGAVARLGGYVRAASLSGDQRTLVLFLARPLSVQTTASDTRLALEMRAAPDQDGKAPPAAKRTAPPAAASVPATTPVAASQPTSPPPSSPGGAAPSRPVPAGVPSPVAEPAASPAAAKAEPVKLPGIGQLPAPVLPVVRLAVSEIPNGVRLGLKWPRPVAAAVFVRGDRLWLVFDGEAEIDAADLSSAYSRWVVSATQLPQPGATVLTVRLAEQLHPVATRDGESWTIDLATSANPPAHPLATERDEVATGRGRLVLPTAGARARIVLSDSDVGDQIVALPLDAPGFGVAQQQDFPEVRILPSAQGVAIVPRADGLVADALPSGIALSAPGGITASSDALARQAVRRDGRAPLVDWRAWQGPADIPFAERRRALMAEAAAKPAAERAEVRLALARLLVANRHGAEAAGLLALLLEADPNLVNDAGFRAIRGIANAQLGRTAEAASDLAHPALEFEPNAALWRARVATDLRHWPEARENYLRGMDAVGEYAPEERAAFHLGAARAAIGTGDLAGAESELSVSDPPESARGIVAEKVFLEGVLAQARGDMAGARTRYEGAIAYDWRPIRVEAEFARTNIELAEKRIPEEEAVARLERLRFAWRGDALERDVATRLADLYIARKDWRAALSLLRDMVAAFPDAPETPGLKARLADLFRSLFLEGAAESMNPVGALALYYDFRDMTPVGQDGDEMIRRLADRLVGVDLLDRAAELLEHQTRFRLAGIAKAQVAARLALVRLLDRQPEKTLAALDQSEQPRLPDDLAAQRRLLRARALADLGRPRDALELVAEDHSPEATELMAEIAWKAGAWPIVATANEELLGAAWQGDVPLDDLARGRVLRAAVAMTLARDGAGLDRLRQRWGVKMRDGTGADAFAIVTGRIDPRTTAFRDLADGIANIGGLESFMAAYRERIREKGLSGLY